MPTVKNTMPVTIRWPRLSGSPDGQATFQVRATAPQAVGSSKGSSRPARESSARAALAHREAGNGPRDLIRIMRMVPSQTVSGAQARPYDRDDSVD